MRLIKYHTIISDEIVATPWAMEAMNKEQKYMGYWNTVKGCILTAKIFTVKIFAVCISETYYHHTIISDENVATPWAIENVCVICAMCRSKV